MDDERVSVASRRLMSLSGWRVYSLHPKSRMCRTCVIFEKPHFSNERIEAAFRLGMWHQTKRTPRWERKSSVRAMAHAANPRPRKSGCTNVS